MQNPLGAFDFSIDKFRAQVQASLGLPVLSLKNQNASSYIGQERWFQSALEKVNFTVSRLYNTTRFLAEWKQLADVVQKCLEDAFEQHLEQFKKARFCQIQYVSQTAEELRTQIDVYYAPEEAFLADLKVYLKAVEIIMKNLNLKTVRIIELQDWIHKQTAGIADDRSGAARRVLQFYTSKAAQFTEVQLAGAEKLVKDVEEKFSQLLKQ